MDENNENMAENKDVFYIPYNSQGKLMDGDINQFIRAYLLNMINDKRKK